LTDTHYTDKQIEVAGWIMNLGFQVELEQVLGRYCLDIYLPEIHAAVEIDGDSHYQKKDDKRDLWLKENYKLDHILHLDFSVRKSEFKRIFLTWIERNFSGEETEKGSS
jgi:hypothetical protein